jgi:site-specific DNA-cytosine methylase
MNNVQNLWEEGELPYRQNWSNFNTTVYWNGTDTHELFLKLRPAGYTETSITYTFNSRGYRTKEFDLTSNRKRILCFGCSHTEGIGVQTPWPEILQSEYPEYDVYNIGQGGCGADTIARLMNNCVSVLKPDAVFVLWPDVARFELIKLIGKDFLFVDYCGNWSDDFRRHFEFYEDIHAYNNFYKNRQVALLLSRLYNFKLYDIAMEDVLEDWSTRVQLPLARDCAHYGLEAQQDITKRFLNLIHADPKI